MLCQLLFYGRVVSVRGGADRRLSDEEEEEAQDRKSENDS